MNIFKLLARAGDEAIVVITCALRVGYLSGQGAVHRGLATSKKLWMPKRVNLT